MKVNINVLIVLTLAALGLGTAALNGCTEDPKTVVNYSVEFLMEPANEAILKDVIDSCGNEVSNGESIDDILNIPNCRNAELAIKERQHLLDFSIN